MEESSHVHGVRPRVGRQTSIVWDVVRRNPDGGDGLLMHLRGRDGSGEREGD